MIDNNSKCVRFAPSPSGRMHFGNIYSAILSWLIARKENAKFIIRMEDIDERSKNKQYQNLILEDLSLLGLDWDEEPIIQSARSNYYEEIFNALSTQAHIYPCFCKRADLHAASAPHASDGTPIYAGTCKNLSDADVAEKLKTRQPAYRIEVPNKEISFHDEIQGTYSQNLAGECGDFVLKRSDGIFAYQLCVVADDIAQGVTDVVRGADLLSSTPRQIYLYELLDKNHPRYFHHPVLLSMDGTRLSKRDKSCDMSYLLKNFSPQDLLGWVAFYLGQIDSAQPLTLQELLDLFTLNNVPNKSAIIADAFLNATALGV